jgi:hypothetical protein
MLQAGNVIYEAQGEDRTKYTYEDMGSKFLRKVGIGLH